jgi:hypothetical protein
LRKPQGEIKAIKKAVAGAARKIDVRKIRREVASQEDAATAKIEAWLKGFENKLATLRQKLGQSEYSKNKLVTFEQKLGTNECDLERKVASAARHAAESGNCRLSLQWE